MKGQLSLWLASPLLLLLISCVPDEGSQGSPTWDAPAAYIPPPENAPAPSEGNGEWIGPDGYAAPTKKQPQ